MEIFETLAQRHVINLRARAGLRGKENLNGGRNKHITLTRHWVGDCVYLPSVYKRKEAK